MNKRYLASKMALYGDKGGDIAEYLGMARSTFSAKLNGTAGAEFTQSEIMKIIQRYELTADEVTQCFFTEKVS